MNASYIAVLLGFAASIILGAAKLKPIIVGAIAASGMPIFFWFLTSSPAAPPSSTDVIFLAPWFILFFVFVALPSFLAGLLGATLGNGLVAHGQPGNRRGVAAVLTCAIFSGVVYAGYEARRGHELDAMVLEAGLRFAAADPSIVAVAGDNPSVGVSRGEGVFARLPVRIRLSVESQARNAQGVPRSSDACLEVSGSRDAPKFSMVSPERCP